RIPPRPRAVLQGIDDRPGRNVCGPHADGLVRAWVAGPVSDRWMAGTTLGRTDPVRLSQSRHVLGELDLSHVWGPPFQHAGPEPQQLVDRTACVWRGLGQQSPRVPWYGLPRHGRTPV